ncbi:MAG: hypothetical protein CMQ16_12385 [Gammaproteobacteria bacterium]|nr:hypothetical protein [Gammaproteobacteria bacterium]
METLLVFSLTLTLNGAQVGATSYWESIDRCRYFARRLENQRAERNVKQPNNTGYIATCTPVVIDKRKDTYWR